MRQAVTLFDKSAILSGKATMSHSPRFNKPINVTTIVTTVFCERKAILDALHGKVTSPDTQHLTQRGTSAHKKYAHNSELLMAQQHEVRLADRRCFIASFALGIDDPDTQLLRLWRDQRLMPSRVGRTMVLFYYHVSPVMVRILSALPYARQACNYILRCIAFYLKGRLDP